MAKKSTKKYKTPCRACVYYNGCTIRPTVDEEKGCDKFVPNLDYKDEKKSLKL